TLSDVRIYVEDLPARFPTDAFPGRKVGSMQRWQILAHIEVKERGIVLSPPSRPASTPPATRTLKNVVLASRGGLTAAMIIGGTERRGRIVPLPDDDIAPAS
ncbi:MAG: hypothetical protein ACXWQ5_13660, partial [Ktedonobacterales bacterium]